MQQGAFVISLDFEIHWGVSDHRTIESYNENLRNVPEVVRRSLDLFERRKIHATWATVGMLFCRNKQELFEQVSPEHRPTYNNPGLSNFLIAEHGAGENEQSDPYHYASSLVKKIVKTPFQEMGTHTYSHYYCLEPGQTPDQFYYDLSASRKLMQKEDVNAISIVFPRNQYNDEYLEQCRKTGYYCYRGNYPSWIYRAEAKSTESRWKRAARFIDTYLPLAGQRHVTAQQVNGLLNVPASCFLRPYNQRFSFLEPLRLRRIKKEMEAAARKKTIYHLWWHPHNFGRNMDQNFKNLSLIIDHFEKLATKYGMVSMNMKEIYEQFEQR
jgi:peptidoglycan/xylan/chitin deacetylase (PgdA/CDA1 family)